jgi:CDP-glucose 4,6-dehydratase
VSWIADRISQLWGNGADWTLDPTASHPHEAHYLFLDTTKAAAELGYLPHWKLEEALSSIVSWYKSFAAGQGVAALTLGQIDQFEVAQKIS